MLVLGLLAGLGLGVGVYSWQLKRNAPSKLYLPEKWPLVSRSLVNPTEDKVWTWLREVFPDYQVMVKTPILRFTTLNDAKKRAASAEAKAQARVDFERWMELLSGVYATFTICTVAGKVVGCIDVPGRTPSTKNTRELKERLLSDCGIAYLMVTPPSLPAASTMRAAFLGEVPKADTVEDQETVVFVRSQLSAEQAKFQAELCAFTKQPDKPSKPAPVKNVRKGF
jgi:hypothetical protein